MHAFDLDKLAGRTIRVRRATTGEAITTLDGVERKLEPDMLVIADRDRAQAVAGVMGGAASEVSASTTRRSCSRARTSSRRRCGARASGSASRPKRRPGSSAAPTSTRRSSRCSAPSRCWSRSAPGSVAGADRRPVPGGRAADAAAPAARAPRVAARRRRARRGRRAHPARPRPRRWPQPPTAGTSMAPTFRVDLLREVDLIEEVGRHYGFDRLEATFPPLTAPAPPPDPRIARDQTGPARPDGRRAVGGGHVRVHRGQGRRAVRGRRAPAPSRIANPLSAKFDTLRPSLLPGLVDAVAHNRRHGRRDVALFEIGARFTRARRDRAASRRVDRRRHAEHWTGGARDVDFFDVKGVVERLARRARRRRLALRRPLAAVSGRRVSAAALTAGADAARRPRTARAGHRRRPRAPRQDAIFVAELDLDAACGRASRTARRACGRCRAIRSSSATSRLSSPTPCLPRSFVAPFRRPAQRRRRRWSAFAFSIAIRARACRTAGQPVGAADVPGARSHADRRRSAAERRADSGRARARARRGVMTMNDQSAGIRRSWRKTATRERGARAHRSSRREGEAARRRWSIG